MSPQLFASCYSESDAARTDHFANAFVCENVVQVMTFENLQLKPFCHFLFDYLCPINNLSVM